MQSITISTAALLRVAVFAPSVSQARSEVAVSTQFAPCAVAFLNVDGSRGSRTHNTVKGSYRHAIGRFHYEHVISVSNRRDDN